MPAWRISVGGGVMTEPILNGGHGGALVVDVARRLTGDLSLVALGVASRATDRGGLSTFGRYDYEREWIVAALGLDTPVLRTSRLDVTIGVQAGAKWSRMTSFAWIGTPPPGEPATRPEEAWDEGVMLVPSLQMAYRIVGPLAVSARLAGVTHIFTDEMIGNSGGLFTVGGRLAW
jgi:hypothetical protein